jgi:hypothetical protein
MTYVDIGAADATVLVSGMGRSGTTWLVDLMNHRFSHRVIFEPFRVDVVPLAMAFGPFAYIRPSDPDPVRRSVAARIFAGRIPRGHVDRMHRGLIFRRRIVKAVRANLMLGWLKTVQPAMPVVVIIRNPLAVASSWHRLGWGQVPGSSQLELDVILSHGELLEDFPIINRAMQHVDRSSVFERAIAEWCISHLVPLSQVATGAAHFVHFEDLLLKPEPTFSPLASYAGIEVNWEAFHRVFHTAAETDFLQRGNHANREQLLGDWMQHLTPEQIDRGRAIVAAFGLDHLYDERGMPAGLAPAGTAAQDDDGDK